MAVSLGYRLGVLMPASTRSNGYWRSEYVILVNALCDELPADFARKTVHRKKPLREDVTN